MKSTDRSGNGSEATGQYSPTEHELRELARYWITEILKSETWSFFVGDIGSHDLWVRTFGRQRLDDIAEVIGLEAVTEIISQAETEFRRTMGDRKWHVFQTGTRAERDGIIEETHAAWDSHPRATKYAVDYLANEAVTIFPELGRDELADAVHDAARSIERGYVNLSPCEHDWQTAPGIVGRGACDGFTLVYERCSKCRAIRERRIYPARGEDEDYMSDEEFLDELEAM